MKKRAMNQNSNRRFVPRTLLLLALAACQTTPPTTHVHDGDSVSQGEKALADGIAESRAANQPGPVSKDVLNALLPPAQPADDAANVNHFDLAVSGVKAPDFFRSLVAGTPYNMVVHPNVQGAVSLDLKDVTVTDVMNVMRDVYGFDYTREGNLFQVFPDAMRTEIFQIDYLNIARKGKSEIQVSSGTISDTRHNNTYNYPYNGNDGINVNTSGNNHDEVVGTQVNTDSEVDFWEQLAATLKSIVGEAPGTSVVVTPQVGLVVVRAMPSAIAAVRTYLDRAQLSLARQVILEAKIIEVTLKAGFEAGIQWNTFGKHSGGSFKPIVDANGNVIAQGSDSQVAGSLTQGTPLDFFNPTSSAFTINMAFSDFEAIIDLLETQGTVQVLSSPRISTVNNQKAVIKVGGDEYFVTNISTQTITAGSAINTQNSPELTPFFSGIALDVTPQISDAGSVTLHVHPSISDVKEQTKTIAGEQVPLAQSTIRESDSVVRARSGQIVVIGGLMESSASDSDAGVPWLSHLPLLGNAFKQKQQQSTKRELVILLKPIVADDDAQIEAMNQSLARLKTMRERIAPGS